MIKFKVTQLESGVKPIGFLKKKIEGDFHTIKTLITTNKIRINNKNISDDYLLKKDDLVMIDYNNLKLKQKKSGVKPIDLKIEIIFEDDKILVLNKPPGIAVQVGTGQSITLANHLSFLEQKKNLDYLNIIHRIDKDTSGIIICAKSPQILRDLHELMQADGFDKNYVCLCAGIPKKSSGKVELYLKIRDDSSEKVVVTKDKSGKNNKYSLSFYKVEKTFNYKNKRYALVDVNIKTGITHQIRVHTKYLGCPIIGDKNYGNLQVNSEFYKLGLRRQFLHSTETSFKYFGKKYNLKAKLPSDLNSFINVIGGKKQKSEKDKFEKKPNNKKFSNGSRRPNSKSSRGKKSPKQFF
jgi:23S rRNA pseudouridine955/2504/2580 synthase